jgi:hypothetical protein
MRQNGQTKSDQTSTRTGVVAVDVVGFIGLKCGRRDDDASGPRPRLRRGLSRSAGEANNRFGHFSRLREKSTRSVG